MEINYCCSVLRANRNELVFHNGYVVQKKVLARQSLIVLHWSSAPTRSCASGTCRYLRGGRTSPSIRALLTQSDVRLKRAENRLRGCLSEWQRFVDMRVGALTCLQPPLPKSGGHCRHVELPTRLRSGSTFHPADSFPFRDNQPILTSKDEPRSYYN